MRYCHRSCVPVLAAFAFGGQQPPPARTVPGQDTVVRIVVNLVQVDAVVTDARDRPVTGLQAEDFEIYQDGRKQKITNFSYVTTGPAPAATPVPAPAKGVPPTPPPRLRREEVRRTIALVVDDLGLSFGSTAQVRDTKTVVDVVALTYADNGRVVDQPLCSAGPGQRSAGAREVPDRRKVDRLRGRGIGRR